MWCHNAPLVYNFGQNNVSLKSKWRNVLSKSLFNILATGMNKGFSAWFNYY